MPRINEAFLNLKAGYLFAEIKRRTDAFVTTHPDARVISLGIGDVTQPLPRRSCRPWRARPASRGAPRR